MLKIDAIILTLAYSLLIFLFHNLYFSLKNTKQFLIILTTISTSIIISLFLFKLDIYLFFESLPFILISLGFSYDKKESEANGSPAETSGNTGKNGKLLQAKFIYEIVILSTCYFLNIPKISDICMYCAIVLIVDFFLFSSFYNLKKEFNLFKVFLVLFCFCYYGLSSIGGFKSLAKFNFLEVFCFLSFCVNVACLGFFVLLKRGFLGFSETREITPEKYSETRENEIKAKEKIEATTRVNPENNNSDTDKITPETSETLALLRTGKLASHSLEKYLSNDYLKAIETRRLFMQEQTKAAFSKIPFENYDYKKVIGVCCENVIGYVPIPLGLAGPYCVDGRELYIPMATTEGCLVASTSRGCKAISLSGGVTTVCLDDGMTRAPCLEFSSLSKAFQFKSYVDSDNGFDEVKTAFESTSRFAKLNTLTAKVVGKLVYLRFKCFTGDAMGMNMISKGVEKSLELICAMFPCCKVVSISGNYCTDKKPSAVNWIEGRGKTVCCEATIKGEAVEKVLKCSVSALVELNIKKNLVGSAVAGSIGGFNAHAANILTAVYLACGQDPAQNVESSNCLTFMEAVNGGKDLYVSVYMPCVEVGTVGGGTGLDAQYNCLELLGVKGVNEPGENARMFARIVCAAVLAGEISLCAALAAGHLVKSHMQHNRIKVERVETEYSQVGGCVR